MSGTHLPTPEPPRPELLLSLPTLRARLEEQRQFRIEQIAALMGVGGAHAGSLDGVPGVDSATDNAQSQVTAALLAGARRALTDIETALYRIMNGQYGSCLQCGAPIGMQRLRTLPQTALCADCHRARGARATEASAAGPSRGVPARPASVPGPASTPSPASVPRPASTPEGAPDAMAAPTEADPAAGADSTARTPSGSVGA
ncbi:hypothetical protein GCM10023322_13370 [Rugosimonospora acidiphila]|uniref:Zinc finger DksA/TraR C4-type domain-containing protein n=1 Tax=Rugosimonospora acidiphila TaxID=556531 RepID=A0ABP9RLV2_9ACTN